MKRLIYCFLLTACLVTGDEFDNSISGGLSERSLSSGDDLVDSVVNDCSAGDESVLRCLKLRVLNYLDSNLNGGKRSIDAQDENTVTDESLDNAIVHRIKKYLTTHNFKLHLPDFFFQKATLVFKPASRALTDFEVEFPPPNMNENRALTEARDMMQQKMVMPVLMMMKVMSKMVTPVMMMMIGIKATKALVLSKVAILLIGGFLFMQLCKKNGMTMPAGMMPASMTIEPAPSNAYGPPPTAPMNSYGPPTNSYGPPMPPSNSYGSPSSSSSSGSSSSYDQAPGSSWEPAPSSSGNSPYARVYDPHQMAYSAYSTIGSSSSKY